MFKLFKNEKIKEFLIAFLIWLVTLMLFVGAIYILPQNDLSKLDSKYDTLLLIDIMIGGMFFIVMVIKLFEILIAIFGKLPKLIRLGIILAILPIFVLSAKYLFNNPKIISYLNKNNISSVGHLFVASESPEETKKKIIVLTNKEREKVGLSLLGESELLDNSAEDKAKDMIKNNYWSHVSPEGVQPWVLFGNVGYRYQSAGENLARDYKTTEEVVIGWMNSPGHKENILNKNFTEIGVAVVDGVLQGINTRLIVQHFGKPYIVSNISTGNNGTTLRNYPSKSGKIIKYTEWCTGKEINIYENEIIVKKALDGNIYGLTEGDWKCYEKNPDEGLLNHKPSRTGNIIPYHEWCTGKDISIYENEKIYRKLKDGKMYWLTAGDWECYDKGMPRR